MTQQEIVLQYFREAELTPSAIDSLLRLPKGRSHELIVGWWQEQKKAAKEVEDMVAALEPKPRIKSV